MAQESIYSSFTTNSCPGRCAGRSWSQTVCDLSQATSKAELKIQGKLQVTTPCKAFLAQHTQHRLALSACAACHCEGEIDENGIRERHHSLWSG